MLTAAHERVYPSLQVANKDALGGALGWTYIPATLISSPTSGTALRGSGCISISWEIHKLAIVNISATGFGKVGLI